MVLSGPAPLDGGWGWLVLAASFINEVLLIGFVKAIGVLFMEWKLEFKVDTKDVAWVGSILAVGGPFACMLAGALTTRYSTRPIVMIGGVFTSLTIAAMSFSAKIWHLYLIATITGVGFGLSFQPSVTIIALYFNKKLGTANGIAYSGVGVGIVVMPPLLQYLSDKYGWRGALQICAAILLIVTLSGLIFRPTERERFLIAKNAEARKSADRSKRSCKSILKTVIQFFGLNLIVSSRRMVVFVTSVAFLGFGYFGTVIFFSSNAVFGHGIPKIHASYLVSGIGVGSAIFRGCHGIILDLKLIGALPVYAIACLASGATVFCTPFCTSFVSLMINAIFFGSFTGLAFAVLLMCLVEFVSLQNVAAALGALMMVNGIGIFFGIFFMGLLHDLTGNYDVPFFAAAASMFFSGILITIEIVYHRYRNPTLALANVDPEEPKKEEVALQAPTTQDQNIISKEEKHIAEPLMEATPVVNERTLMNKEEHVA